MKNSSGGGGGGGGGGAQLGIYLFESQVFLFKKAKEEPFI